MQLKQNEETNQLNEEEVIEAELDKQYRKKEEKEGFLKRKFKPFLKGKEGELNLKQKNYLQSSKFNPSFTCAESLGSSNTIEKLARIGAYTSIAALAGIYATEAFAVNPDVALENFAKASFSPFVKVLKDYWAAPVAIGAIGAAAIGGGDGRERAEKALKGGAFGAMVVLGALALMPA